MLKERNNEREITILSLVFLAIALFIIVRLLILQILQHDYYSLFALNTHEIYQKLYPARGSIYYRDARGDKEYPAAVNRGYYLVYAVPQDIPQDKITEVGDKLSEVFGFVEEDKTKLLEKLSKSDDPYEPVQKKVDEATWEKIAALNLPGIYKASQKFRYYPEANLASNILGFTGESENGSLVGSYGLEGYWNKELSGKSGFLAGEQGALGSWIASAGRTLVKAEEGRDLVLTLDRSVQNKACAVLKKGFEEYKAKSASLILMNPKTGAVYAMCSYPDFDPNNYSKVKNLEEFNNTNIFTAYEPGSVFKPITMAAALDQNLVNPNTTFQDPCERKIDGFTIRNALKKCYGRITMTQTLENSVNTAMIWVQEQLGRERFQDYVKKFGFGEKTGIELNTEVEGNISSLEKKGKVYGAVGSFGQGLTVTPMQIATAYAAIANGGKMPRPYVVAEQRYADGRKEKTEPRIVENVISERAAKLLTGMMVSVVENTYTTRVKLDHYYVAGKTGTAQIPGKGGYTEETNHTFGGFFPADDPGFVMVVKYEAPQREWAESTAAPTFKEVAEFVLKYFAVPEER